MTKYGTCKEEIQLRKVGWWDRLAEIIPELHPLTGTRQSPEHHAEGDVATHTRLAVEACPPHCDPDLLWVSLLHEIVKPGTTVKQKDGRITAHGHAMHGAELAERVNGLTCPKNAADGSFGSFVTTCSTIPGS